MEMELGVELELDKNAFYKNLKIDIRLYYLL